MHIRFLISTIILLITACSSGGSGDFDGGTGGTGVRSLKGKVIDQRGSPIENIKIESADGLGSSITDKDGNYSFDLQTDASQINLLVTNAGNQSSITLSGLEQSQIQISLDLQYAQKKLVKVAGTSTSDQGSVILGSEQIKINNGNSSVEIDPDGGLSVGSNNGGVTVGNDGEVVVESDNGEVIINPNGSLELDLL